MKKAQIEVQKYGGTSVGNFERISQVAQHIKECLTNPTGAKKIVVVVSAMDKTTDELIAQAKELVLEPDPRELDQLLQTGETKSAAFLAMKLVSLGIKAKSLTASQIGLETNNRYGNAAILGLRNKKLVFRLLKQFDVLVITGFQGIAPGEIDEITTVGRGGSDTIAVALAVELKAKCTIYTDVDGVHTADPRKVKRAKKFKIITPDQMLMMYEVGAKVMAGRSVKIAKKFGIPVTVKLSPSFGESDGGTLITNFPAHNIESLEDDEFVGLGIKDIGIIKIAGLTNTPDATAKLFREFDVNILEIIKHPTKPGDLTTITIILERQNIASMVKRLEKIKAEDEIFSNITIYSCRNLVALTLIDLAMVDNIGYMRRILDTLAKIKINNEAIFSAGERLGVVVDERFDIEAAQALAAEFELIYKS